MNTKDWKKKFEIMTQDYDIFDSYVCCNGGITGDVDCSCNGITWKEKIQYFIETLLKARDEEIIKQAIEAMGEEKEIKCLPTHTIEGYVVKVCHQCSAMGGYNQHRAEAIAKLKGLIIE